MNSLKTRVVSKVAGVAVAASTILAGFSTAPAHAYDGNNCASTYGAAAVQRVEQFKIDTSPRGGKVDFGDDPHWFGAPQGTAVLCWLTNGQVGIKGRVMVDSPDWHDVRVSLEWRNGNGNMSGATTAPYRGVNGSSTLVDVARNANGARATSVVVTLQRRQTSMNPWVTDAALQYWRGTP